MHSGQLIHRLELLKPDATTNPDGFIWVATVPALIELAGSGGAEVLRFGAPTATGQYRIVIRYRQDVSASWRGKRGDQVFQISSYGDPDGRRTWLHLFCVEVQ